MIRGNQQVMNIPFVLSTRLDQKGLTLRFVGEGASFIQYLESRTLHIDIWDGDSLLLIGNTPILLLITVQALLAWTYVISCGNKGKLFKLQKILIYSSLK
jgi:hypothetical protein